MGHRASLAVRPAAETPCTTAGGGWPRRAMTDTVDPRRARIQELFASAVSLGPTARSAALDRECDGDPALRQAVHELLDDYDSAKQFFAQFPEGFAREVVG